MMIIVIMVQPNFTYIYPFPLLKIFLAYLATLAHTAHADLVVDFPLFSSFLIFTPRQQGWLASTISCPLVCNPLNNTRLGCNGADVLVVQPGYQNSIILIANKYQNSLLLELQI